MYRRGYVLRTVPVGAHGGRGSMASALHTVYTGQAGQETVSTLVCDAVCRGNAVLRSRAQVTAGVMVRSRTITFGKPDLISVTFRSPPVTVA